jgi:hypothetical protein
MAAGFGIGRPMVAMGPASITFCAPRPFPSGVGGKNRTMNRFFAAGFLSALPALLALAPRPASAQASESPADGVRYGWKRQAAGMLSLSQAYYDNWTKGGTDALAYELNLGGSAVYDQEKYEWATKARAVYGRTKVGSLASRKSLDEADLESIYTYKLAVMVNPFASVTGQTQFMPGFVYPDDTTRVRVSEFFNPAYFTQTLGVGITPYKGLKERLGASMKQTLYSENYKLAADNASTEKVDGFKQEYGATSITEYELQLMENIKGSTRLEVFANFKGWDETDARWSNQIAAKVNSLISVNFEYEMLYDKDLSESYQTREGLSVGISFLKL